MLVEIFLLLVVAFFAFHRWRRAYWRRKGVYSIDGDIVFGTTGKMFFTKTPLTRINNFIGDVYKNHKDKKLIGFFNFYEPMLVVTDTDYFREMLVSKFNSFSNAGLEVSSADKLIKYNAFMYSGEQWKINRGIQAPMVSQGRLKEHFSTMTATCQGMVKYLMENQSHPIKVADLTRYYTINMISSVVYGLEPSAYVDPENGFRKNVTSLISEDGQFVWACSSLMPIICHLLRLRLFTKSAEEFFVEIAQKTFEFRKKNRISRNDLFDHLIKINERRISEGKEAMNADEIASHMVALYTDSVDTSGNVLSYILLELGNRPEVQERLREEIMSVGKDIGSFDYEKAHSITYLNQVINESLRLHPIIHVFKRVCTKTTRLGGVEIEEGTKIFIPYGNINLDPEYYPDPEDFNPDRFSPENEEQIRKRFIPFGEGPKQCLGMRYATLQIKLGIIAILLNFKLTALNKTDGKKVADTQDEKVVFTRPDDKELLIFEKIDHSKI